MSQRGAALEGSVRGALDDARPRIPEESASTCSWTRSPRTLGSHGRDRAWRETRGNASASWSNWSVRPAPLPWPSAATRPEPAPPRLGPWPDAVASPSRARPLHVPAPTPHETPPPMKWSPCISCSTRRRGRWCPARVPATGSDASSTSTPRDPVRSPARSNQAKAAPRPEASASSAAGGGGSKPGLTTTRTRGEAPSSVAATRRYSCSSRKRDATLTDVHAGPVPT